MKGRGALQGLNLSVMSSGIGHLTSWARNTWKVGGFWWERRKHSRAESHTSQWLSWSSLQLAFLKYRRVVGTERQSAWYALGSYSQPPLRNSFRRPLFGFLVRSVHQKPARSQFWRHRPNLKVPTANSYTWVHRAGLQVAPITAPLASSGFFSTGLLGAIFTTSKAVFAFVAFTCMAGDPCF